MSNTTLGRTLCVSIISILAICILVILHENQYVSMVSQPLKKVYHLFDDLKVKVDQNPFFQQLNVTRKAEKLKVNLLLIVSTAPARYDRRENIRKTWWTECKSSFQKSVRCIFMTDKVTKESKYYKQLSEEASKHDDIEFQNLKGGVQFGVRMVYHMLHAYMNYDFDYFLRLDDDYFICAKKLIFELPMPPLRMFHWGWVHRTKEINLRRAEESVFMVSRDVIEKYLSQDASSMLCHPWADQMIILWSGDLNIRHIYRHDSRLHHHPPVRDMKKIREDKNICEHYIGVHGAYPHDMINLWDHRGSNNNFHGNIHEHSVPVTINENFCWSCFTYPWRYEPRPCIENFHWDTSKQGGDSYAGRSGSI